MASLIFVVQQQQAFLKKISLSEGNSSTALVEKLTRSGSPEGSNCDNTIRKFFQIVGPDFLLITSKTFLASLMSSLFAELEHK